MTTLTRTRLKVPHYDPMLALCAGIGKVARWLAGLIPEPRTMERYTGHFGADERLPYDQMTTQEHDECGAFWSYCDGDEIWKG